MEKMVRDTRPKLIKGTTDRQLHTGIEVIGAVAYPPDYEEKQVIDRNACESTRKIAPSYGIEYPLKTKYGRQRLLHGVKVVGEHRKGFSVCGALALAIMLIVIVTPIALVIPKQNGR